MRGSKQVLGAGLYFEMDGPDLCHVKTESYTRHSPVAGDTFWSVERGSQIRFVAGAWQPHLRLRSNGRNSTPNRRMVKVYTDTVMDAFLAWERKRNARATLVEQALQIAQENLHGARQAHELALAATDEAIEAARQAAELARTQAAQLDEQIAQLEAQRWELHMTIREPDELRWHAGNRGRAAQELRAAKQQLMRAERAAKTLDERSTEQAAASMNIGGIGLDDLD